MSNRSRWSRFRISSTARTPAMPLPITTSCALVVGCPLWSAGAVSRRVVIANVLPLVASLNFNEAEVDDDGAAHSFGGCNEDFENGVGEQILDHPQRHVGGALGGDREVAHRVAVADQDHTDHFVRAVAAAKIHRLRSGAGWNHIAQRAVQQDRRM